MYIYSQNMSPEVATTHRPRRHDTTGTNKHTLKQTHKRDSVGCATGGRFVSVFPEGLAHTKYKPTTLHFTTRQDTRWLAGGWARSSGPTLPGGGCSVALHEELTKDLEDALRLGEEENAPREFSSSSFDNENLGETTATMGGVKSELESCLRQRRA